jgi:hypothetical protein
MLAFLLVFGLWLVYLGFQGWVVSGGLPIQYIGYLLLVFWLAGLFGVNIWYGGPLDPRRDRPTTQSGELRSYRCEICGFAGSLEPSVPLADACCPKCGTLLFPSGARQ